MSTSGFSVSIPNSVRKTIQAIKEITGNHSEEKIYALLKECSMDPNETAQKLLLQETFHGVKRKHVRRKKNLSNKQPGEVRWRSGTQGRGGRGGRVALSPHFTSHDGGRGRSSGPGKENGLNQGAEKDLASLPTSYENKNKERSSVTRSAPVIANGPTNIASGSTSTVHASNILAGSGDPEISLSYAGKDISSSKLNPGYANKNPIAVGTEDSWEQPAPTPTSSLAVCFSSSDPVLEPSNDSQVPAALGLEREVGSHCLPATEIGSSSAQGMMPNSFQGVGKSQHTELSYSFSISTHGGFSVSLPSSNYSSWPQQIICGQNDAFRYWSYNCILFVPLVMIFDKMKDMSTLLVLIRSGNQSLQVLPHKVLEQLVHLRFQLLLLMLLPCHNQSQLSLIQKKQNCRRSWRNYTFHNVNMLFYQTTSMSLNLKGPS
ncbi:uncharacterized protein LOC107433879 isoform X2 [Ziziphus jujuba]|uniref:Uncharacterized protein LOC107433879 isoform X2 n=1 Tax=Ziziphus jujuba TaxID=326968 RepID=A0A6P4AQG7_ZIZJJ|nr:uncharacterized protein LOC107433879 isoform X2 [Ziziphus jujuba]